MVTLRARIRRPIERLLGACLALTGAGSMLAFGGVVWWWRPVLTLLTLAAVTLTGLRILVDGRLAVIKSPIAGLGLLVLMLVACQLAPLPDRLARLISPASRALHATGVMADQARADDPDVSLPASLGHRSPVTIDRSATLRWGFGFLLCFSWFWVTSQFVDRFEHYRLMLGGLGAGFLVVTALGLIEVLGGASILGGVVPVAGAWWGPSELDLISSPGRASVQVIGTGAAETWALKAERGTHVGTLVNGPGAYLALGVIIIPLSWGAWLWTAGHDASRRVAAGSTTLVSGAGGVLALMNVMACGLFGWWGGWASAVVLALVLVLPALVAGHAGRSGIRPAIQTLLVLSALGVGSGLHGWLGPGEIGPDLGRGASLQAWREVRPAVAEFPRVGAGLGTAPTVLAYSKSSDGWPTVAPSSLATWWVESGLVGLILLSVLVAWVLARVVRAWNRVGPADRSLAAGLAASLVCLALFGAVHWSIELPAAALAASMVLGVCDRWLAGGTDLFIERGEAA